MAAPFGPVCFVEVKARGLARAGAEVVLLDTGHFALEEEADTIAEHTGRLLRTTFTG